MGKRDIRVAQGVVTTLAASAATYMAFSGHEYGDAVGIAILTALIIFNLVVDDVLDFYDDRPLGDPYKEQFD